MYTQFRLGMREELEIKASATNWTLHVQSRKPTYTTTHRHTCTCKYLHTYYTCHTKPHLTRNYTLQCPYTIQGRDSEQGERERERERERAREREIERVSYVDLEPMILSLFPRTVFGNQRSFVPPPKQAAAASNT